MFGLVGWPHFRGGLYTILSNWDHIDSALIKGGVFISVVPLQTHTCIYIHNIRYTYNVHTQNHCFYYSPSG